MSDVINAHDLGVAGGYIIEAAMQGDIDRLRAENAKLKQELEAVGTAAYLYGRTDLADENSKLRQLVKEMRVCLEDECKRCHEWGDACDLEHQMRELGIEVDG